MLRLSTGEPSTLGTFRDYSAAIFGPDSPATAFLDERIARASRGAEVIQDEGQMVMMLAQLHLQSFETTANERERERGQQNV